MMQKRGFRWLGVFVVLFLAVIVLFGMTNSAAAQPNVKVSGYEIDVTGDGPAVPKDLEAKGKGKYKKWIVQFTGPIYKEQKEALKDLGCIIGDYLPEFAFIITMDSKTRKKVKALSFINGAARFKPAYKIHKKLKGEDGSVTVEKGKKITLHVRVDGAHNLPVLLSKVHKKKGKVLDVGSDVARVEVDQADIAHLAHLEEVLWIEEAVQMELLNDTSKWVIQTYELGNTKIWDKGLHGENQIVAIGDTGLDYDMPWFIDSTNPIGPLHRKVVGYDSTYGDDYDSNFGHGSHVAGTVGGDQTPLTGSSTANGMAPKSKFFIQDITPGESRYVYPPADLGLMFITTYEAGARLHTNSWGGGGSSYGALSASADRFMWEHPDFLALFSNGNSGPSTGTVGYPASAKNVVSVGATGNGTSAEDVASFSSNGPAADGRIKPTVTAPGVGIISADSDGIKDSYNSGTRSYSGTSMAAPTVAGAAALIRQYFMDGYWPSGTASSSDGFTPSAALVKATLVNSAQNMTGAYTDAPIPSTGQGWGRINLSNALTFSGDTTTLEVVDSATSLATGESWSETYFSSAGQPLKVTLVWTDYPGAAGANPALVNDLDLTIIAPDGTTTYIGNVFESGVSITGGTADRLNVEEQVLLPTPEAGSYTVTVSGYNIPNGPQPFALVITGASSVTSKGFVTLNKGRYTAPSTVEVKVGDRDLDLDSAARDIVKLKIKSDTEPYGVLVTLIETSVNSGIFIGNQKLYFGAADKGNAFLDVVEHDTIWAEYEDEDDGTGAPALVTASAVIDMTDPIITNVTAGALGETSATITWTTDEPANTLINYGEGTTLGIYQGAPRLTTEHAISLAGLKEAQVYSHEVYSTDEAGNTAKDNNGGSLYTFTTINVPPSLTVNSSEGSETYLPETVIYGTALDPSGVATVTVNGLAATYRASDGYYELALSLVIGANTINVIATDTLDNAKPLTISVTRLEPPDLMMTEVSGPATGATGGPITITDTVTNKGPGDSRAFYVGFYLSVDDVCDTSDTYIGRRYVASLAAGVSSPGSTAVTLSSYLTPGTYYLCANADYSNIQYESDEANNGITGNQIQIKGPDLTMTVVSGPEAGLTGQVITVSNTVTNVSADVTSGGFYVGIYLSTDDVITTSDIRMGYRYVSSLAPGASNAADFAVTIPANTAGGLYYIAALADFTNRVKEEDEANNALTGGRITVTGADLAMTTVSGPDAAKTGEAVTVTNTVTASAAGGNAGGFYVGVYLSTDEVITTSDLRVGYRYVSSLAAGASDTAETSVTIPTTLAGGTYYFGGIADIYDYIKGEDETDNIKLGNAVAVTGADLAMTAVSGPDAAKTGEVVTVTNTVTASAAGGNARGFYVGVYLSTDEVITTSDLRVGYRYVSSLAAGASDTAETSVTIPTTLAGGTYYFGGIADIYDYIKGEDETDNIKLGNAVGVTGAELTMTAVSGPTTGKTGETITVSTTVTTSAGGAGGFYVGMYLSADAEVTTADAFLGNRYVSSLAPGASDTADTAVTIPSTVPGETYYIGAIADYTNRVKEVNETDNSKEGNRIIVTGADLTMTAVSGPTSAKTGEAITVSNTVTSVAGGATGFYVAIYLSPDADITTADTRLTYRYVSVLAPGASDTADTAVTIPSSIAGNTYYIGAIADFNNRVVESVETNNAKTGNTIGVTGAELSMTKVSGPTTAKTGDVITVSNTVAAAADGGGATGFYVGIYLSADNVITTADYYVGNRYITSLAAGASDAVDTTVTIPSSIAGGTYYIGAIADYNNRVVESVETNNALAGNEVALTGADLTMTVVSGPATAKTGDTITVSNTVTASAAGGGATGFYVGIYLSTDAVITTTDAYLGRRLVSSLAPGASDAADTSVTIPSTISGDTYYIGAIADTYNGVKESDETNNVLAGNQVALTGADLTMTVVSGPTTAKTGDVITVSNTVTAAAGGGATGFYVGIYLSADDVITTADYYLGNRYITSLAGGASDATAASVTIPSSIAGGTYYIGAIADYNNRVAESDETNNTLAGNQVTLAGADLTMTVVSGPATAKTGDVITVSNTVTAASAGGGATGFYVAIYLSADAEITTADTRVVYRYVSSLVAGASDAADTAVTIPSSIAGGTYYIGAIADFTNRVAESVETNNALAGNEIVVTGADLTMTAVSGPAEAKTGDVITVSNTVAATGGGATGFYVGIYLSTDNVITTADTFIGNRYLSTLAADTSSADDTVITLPSTAATGTYYIGAIADYTNRAVESDETNNTAVADQTISVTGTDLTMTAVSGPTSAKTGEAITVSNTVAASAAGGGATGFYVAIYLSVDNVITTADTYIGRRYVTSLAAGTSDEADTAITVPTTIAGGTYFIGAIADYSNIAKESDETNNALAGDQITVTAADLTVSAVSGPTTGSAGGTITVSDTVAASAAGGTARSFYVGIYASIDNVITTSDIYLGRRYVGGLAPGATSAADTVVTIPTTVAAGAYYLGAVADVYSYVQESDEDNNSLAGDQITITIP